MELCGNSDCWRHLITRESWKQCAWRHTFVTWWLATYHAVAGWIKPDKDANSGEVAAVTSRAQEKRERQTTRPQMVARSGIPDVSAQILKEAQQNDRTLGKVWKSARAKTQQQTRGKTIYRYEVQKESEVVGMLCKVVCTNWQDEKCSLHPSGDK